MQEYWKLGRKCDWFKKMLVSYNTDAYTGFWHEIVSETDYGIFRVTDKLNKAGHHLCCVCVYICLIKFPAISIRCDLCGSCVIKEDAHLPAFGGEKSYHIVDQQSSHVSLISISDLN